MNHAPCSLAYHCGSFNPFSCRKKDPLTCNHQIQPTLRSRELFLKSYLPMAYRHGTCKICGQEGPIAPVNKHSAACKECWISLILSRRSSARVPLSMKFIYFCLHLKNMAKRGPRSGGLMGRKGKVTKGICYLLYYLLARWLPPSYCPGRRLWRKIRLMICRPLFEECGVNVNIEAGAYFGSGKGIAIGDHSGIGVDARILGPVKIGKNVMMGHEVLLIGQNHKFSDLHIPMSQQGYDREEPITIGDDGWVGARAIILPGVSLGRGVVIGAGSVVTQDIPEWAVAAGNPARVIRFRKQEANDSGSAPRMEAPALKDGAEKARASRAFQGKDPGLPGQRQERRGRA